MPSSTQDTNIPLTILADVFSQRRDSESRYFCDVLRKYYSQPTSVLSWLTRLSYMDISHASGSTMADAANLSACVRDIQQYDSIEGYRQSKVLLPRKKRGSVR